MLRQLPCRWPVAAGASRGAGAAKELEEEVVDGAMVGSALAFTPFTFQNSDYTFTYSCGIAVNSRQNHA